MSTKTFVILCIVIALLGIGVGVVLTTRPAEAPPKPLIQPPDAKKTVVSEPQKGNAPLSFNTLPSPVISPVQDIVGDIGENTMTVTGVNGGMTLPLDASVVKLFRRQGDAVTPLPLSELKKGDSVEVNIIKPGELIHLIVR